MGAAGALGLFVSIIFHEFCHSLVARKFGMAMKGITLFIFGGVAEMEEEPPNARTEALMALAGPLSSYALAVVAYALSLAGAAAGWPPQVTAVTSYLALINVLLATFNLIPAFPLDGGRVLRAALWGWKGNLRAATRVASRVGSVFGFGLIALGLLELIAGNVIGGVWWFLIGLFLQGSARSAYQRMQLSAVLAGEPVRRFMSADPVTVPAALTVERFVEDFGYRYPHKMFPVVDGTRPVGCLLTRQVREVPRAEWARRTVAELVRPLSPENTVGPDADAMQVLSTMSRTGNSRLMVIEEGRLVGVIALKDLLRFFQLKLDLEGFQG
jgi:Zn-dependent protease